MKFVAAFEEDNEVAPVIVDAEGCVFPAAGLTRAAAKH